MTNQNKPDSSGTLHCIDFNSILTSKYNNGKPNFSAAALFWHEFGLQVIPIVPGTKRTAVKWDPWLRDLSVPAISRYWAKHPDHEIGCIAGPDIIAFDTDAPESLVQLLEMETRFGLEPMLVVNTVKGQHHYYRLPKDVLAKSDSHSSEKHPDRIDVKTGRAMIVLPPSGGKEVATHD